jgi:aspartate aminotransferase
MPFLAKRVQGTAPSPTLAITARAKKMKAEGIDVLSFGAGEPDFDTPRSIKEAGVAAINNGFTKYTPASGTEELKKAVVEKFARDNALEYDPSEVIITCGAKHALFNLALTLFEEGDEVLVPAPYWVSYPEQIKLAGATPVVVPTREAFRFTITMAVLGKKITPKTKAIILNSPSNPTGTVYEKESLIDLAKFIIDNNLLVISDECYERLLYDGKKHISIASLGRDIRQRTIVVNAVSKTYSMTGWRIGYAAGPRDIIQSMANLQSQSTSNPSSISQKAAVEALSGDQGEVEHMVAEFDKRRKYIVERLNAIPRVSCQTPSGAFYVFANFSKLYKLQTNGQVILSSTDMATYLLDEAKVAVIPGIAFGCDDYIRLSYACSMENIEKGLDRIETALAQLK